jgi:hypothetical protein
MTEECIFNIPIFSWDAWEESDINQLVFYNAIFKYPSMEKYNGKDVGLDRNGLLEIYDDNGNIIFSDFVINIKEYREELLNIL